jgi:hypothetical protein
MDERRAQVRFDYILCVGRFPSIYSVQAPSGAFLRYPGSVQWKGSDELDAERGWVGQVKIMTLRVAWSMAGGTYGSRTASGPSSISFQHLLYLVPREQLGHPRAPHRRQIYIVVIRF